jgi:hypothetical protein
MSAKQENSHLVSRREALRHATTLLGGVALVGGSGLVACASTAHQRIAELQNELFKETAFSQADIEFLTEVSDTILPETETPGARAAGVGPFVALMVTDVYSPDERETFKQGMRTLESECLAMHGRGYMACTPEERLSLLETLDKEQHSYMNSKSDNDPAHYFRMMKEQTLLGYFTSEIGYTKAMRYEETPGRFDPCVPYSPGDKIWARHA